MDFTDCIYECVCECVTIIIEEQQVMNFRGSWEESKVRDEGEIGCKKVLTHEILKTKTCF